MFFRVLAGVLFTLAALMEFGWLVAQDTARGIGCIAAGLLCLVLSSVPIAPLERIGS